VRVSRIKKFAAIADELDNSGKYEAAFILRWIAFEGALIRACVKALWQRGASVKDAENTLAMIYESNQKKLVAWCCGMGSEPIKNEFIRRVKKNGYFRNSLFHQSVVVSKSKMTELSKEIAAFLHEPSKFIGDLPVRVSIDGAAHELSLGNPFADLRKSRARRIPGVKRISAKELLPWSAEGVVVA